MSGRRSKALRKLSGKAMDKSMARLGRKVVRAEKRKMATPAFDEKAERARAMRQAARLDKAAEVRGPRLARRKQRHEAGLAKIAAGDVIAAAAMGGMR